MRPKQLRQKSKKISLTCKRIKPKLFLNRSWSHDEMKMAIETIKEKGITLREASRRFKIPLTTLSVYLRSEQQKEEPNESANASQEISTKKSVVVLNSGRSKSWSIEQMRQAVYSVTKKGMTQKQVAHKFNIPRSSLNFYLKQKIERNENGQLSDKIIKTKKTNGKMKTTIKKKLKEKISNEIHNLSNHTNKSSNQSMEKRSDQSDGDLGDAEEDVSDGACIETVTDTTYETSNIYLKLFDWSSERPTTVAKKSTSPLKFYFRNSQSIIAKSSNTHVINNVDSILSKAAAASSQTIQPNINPSEHPQNTNAFINSIISNKNLNIGNVPVQDYEKNLKIYAYIAMRQRTHPVYMNRNLNYIIKNNRQQTSTKRSLKNKINNESIVKSLCTDSTFFNSEDLLSNGKELTIDFDCINLNENLKQLISSIPTFTLTVEVFNSTNLNQLNDAINFVGQCPIKLMDDTSPNESSKIKLNSLKCNSYLLFNVYLHAINDKSEAISHNTRQNKRRNGNTTKTNFTTGLLETESSILRKFSLIFQINQQNNFNVYKDNQVIPVITFNFKENSSQKFSFSLNTQNDDEEKPSEIESNHQSKINNIEALIHQFKMRNLIKFNLQLNHKSPHKTATSTPINIRTSPRSVCKPNDTFIFDELNTDELAERKKALIAYFKARKIQQQKTQKFKSIINKKVTSKVKANGKCASLDDKHENLKLFFQFNFNNPLKQQQQNGKNKYFKINTQIDKLICPFCHMKLLNLNCLSIHLSNTHFRFHYKYPAMVDPTFLALNGGVTLLSNGMSHKSNGELAHCNGHHNGINGSSADKQLFDIWCDDIYDGSYAGNWYDLYYSAHKGYSKCRLEPSKRLSVTYVIVNKKANHIDLSQFTDLTQSELAALTFIQQQQQQYNYQMQPNKVFNCQASMERVYYHTTTNLPVLVNEIDYDSDNELDTDWLKEHTSLLINDFADVNEGEKALMKLWNLHILKYNFICDSNVYDAIELFIKENYSSLSSLNVFNNFLLHLASFNDYGLIKFEQIIQLVDLFDSMGNKTNIKEEQVSSLKLTNSNIKFEPMSLRDNKKLISSKKSF